MEEFLKHKQRIETMSHISATIAHEIRKVFMSYPEITKVVSQIGSPDDGTDPNNYSHIEFFADLKPQEEWRPQFKTKEELVEAVEAD